LSSEYESYFPHPQKGFSSVEAVLFLNKELPSYIGWIQWDCYANNTSYNAMQQAGRIINSSSGKNGKIASWTWARVDTNYPNVSYWNGNNKDGLTNWTGVVEFVKDNKRVLLFSYLSSLGIIGRFYLAYTPDTAIITELCEDIAGTLEVDGVLVRVWGGRDFTLTSEPRNNIFILAQGIQEDIDMQCKLFFNNKQAYKNLGVSYRRGLLFSGPPGNGKTAETRRVLRRCSTEFGAQGWLLNITRNTSEYDLDGIFAEASNSETPGIVVLEDMDSLTQESQITRTGLLARLDGINPREGVLVIGTTNNPGDIDPALAQRPSRFDRVFVFENPDRSLREQYLKQAFPNTGMLKKLVEQTNNWSFAYMNELRVTASLLAILNKSTTITDADISTALQLLLRQFNMQRK